MMEVSVSSIISERSFGVIFAGVSEGRKLRFRAGADVMAGTPAAGEIWRIEGKEKSTAYGNQVEVSAGRRVLSNGSLVSRFLAGHVRGIGPERAERLRAAYGESLGAALSDPANVRQIGEVLCPGRPLLGVELAAAAVRLWKDTSGEARLLAWLDEIGISDLPLARRLYRLASDKAVDQLKANPYALVPLLPWAKLDLLGQRIVGAHGVQRPERDDRRVVGAFDETMKALLASGSTCADPDATLSGVRSLLGSGAVDLDPELLIKAEAAGAVVTTDHGLAPPGAAAMERSVLGHLQRLQRASGGPTSRNIANALRHVAGGDSLHEEQRVAVERILSRPISCLSGGAGVGKTFTCRVICDAWEATGGTLLLCALAGKAALRLSRSTRRLARTLARTLAELGQRERQQDQRDDRFWSEDGPNALASITDRTLVVVDEASMVDLATMHSLLRRMPDGSRLLLVGDEAQLPPVGFGLIFHRLVDDPAISSRLTAVHRQAAATGIPAASAAMRSLGLPELPAYAGRHDGVSILPCTTADLAETVERVVIEIAESIGDTLVVTATHGGPAGVTALNERLQEASYRRSGVAPIRGMLGRFFAAGEPVIYGRNDYRQGLFNGMMGRVAETCPDDGTLTVLFDGETEARLLEREQLLDLQLAYAVTCHKCQGSSAPRIVVPLYGSRILEPSWLYTAVTRAERQIVFVGSVDVLAKALERPRAADRRWIGFSWPA